MRHSNQNIKTNWKFSTQKNISKYRAAFQVVFQNKNLIIFLIIHNNLKIEEQKHII